MVLIDPYHDEIQADKWPEMAISEINAQVSILEARLTIAMHSGNPELIKMIQSGINKAQFIVYKKAGHEKVMSPIQLGDTPRDEG